MRVLATAAGSFSLAVFAANCIPLLEGALLPLSCALAALCAVVLKNMVVENIPVIGGFLAEVINAIEARM